MKCFIRTFYATIVLCGGIMASATNMQAMDARQQEIQKQQNERIKALNNQLCEEISKKHPDLARIETLIAEGAQIDGPATKATLKAMGGYPLMIAILQGKDEIASLFLEKNADPNIMDQVENTFFMVAVSSGSLDIVTKLVGYLCSRETETEILTPEETRELTLDEWYALPTDVYDFCIAPYTTKVLDINHQNISGQTALIIATSQQNKKMVKLLLDNRAGADICDEANQTPLMIAAAKGNIELVKMLLDYGARTDIVDKQGKTAYNHARSDEICNLLPPHDIEPHDTSNESDYDISDDEDIIIVGSDDDNNSDDDSDDNEPSAKRPRIESH
jgi:ankyrin repeat protein